MFQNPRKSVRSHKRILPGCAMVLFSFALVACKSDVNSKENESAAFIELTVENPIDFSLQHSLIHIKQENLQSDTEGQNSWKAFVGEDEIPSQWNATEPAAGLVFVLPEIDDRQKLDIEIRKVPDLSTSTYTKLTQAELSHKFGGEFKDREYLGGLFAIRNSQTSDSGFADIDWFRFEK